MSAERPYSSRPREAAAGAARCPACGSETRSSSAGTPSVLTHRDGCPVGDALGELELVACRRLGSGVVHFALVAPDAMLAGTCLGAECDFVDAPVVAFCRRTLRGVLVRIPDELVADWRRKSGLCRACDLVAGVAIDRPELLVEVRHA